MSIFRDIVSFRPLYHTEIQLYVMVSGFRFQVSGFRLWALGLGFGFQAFRSDPGLKQPGSPEPVACSP
jgi:hypothetical protein